MVLLSSMVLHRSGANLSDKMRRVYMPQFSIKPIRYKNQNPDTPLVAWAVPIK
jgi:hypothetical protein